MYSFIISCGQTSFKHVKNVIEGDKIACDRCLVNSIIYFIFFQFDQI